MNALGQISCRSWVRWSQLVSWEIFPRPYQFQREGRDLLVDTGASMSLVIGRAWANWIDPTERACSHAPLVKRASALDAHHSLSYDGELHVVTCVAVAPITQVADFPPYGSSDGLLGLREMVRYGAILDSAIGCVTLR